MVYSRLRVKETMQIPILTEKHIGIAEIDVKDMTFTTGMFEDCIKLSSFDFKNGTDKVTNMSRMFKNCTTLSSIKMGQLKSSMVTDLSYMFMGCTYLKKLNISNFDTSNVINMTCLFDGCSSLKELNLENFNTNNVIRSMHSIKRDKF